MYLSRGAWWQQAVADFYACVLVNLIYIYLSFENFSGLCGDQFVNAATAIAVNACVALALVCI